MTKTNYFFVFSLMILLFTGCSSSDDSDNEIQDKPVVFNSLTASKTLSFIDEVITLNIDGEQFTDVVVSSSDPTLVITEVSSTTYNIEASEAQKATISVQLKNNSFTETESVNLEFFEHGIKDFKIVEGIEVDRDNTDKVIALLGEPEAKQDTSDGENEFWYYFSKGFSLLVRKSTNIVQDSRFYGLTTWTRTINDVEFTGVSYPHEIGNSWELPNGQLRMETVVDKLGEPDNKVASTNSATLKWYVYSEGVVFFFGSDSLDDFTGKPVPYINIF